jgi:hypothetical protein
MTMETTKTRYTYARWSIKVLLERISNRSLDLQPHYQRNAIWSASAQRRLIKTIKDGCPLPSLFIRELKNGKYEMVDGQQRCRAIFAYWKGELADDDKVVMTNPSSAKGKLASPEWRKIFESFELQVALLDQSFSDPEVEKFYVLLNTSGVRLNSPELRKADYYDTNFLSIVRELCDLDQFKSLNLFGQKSVDRMNDVEFVSELLAFLLHGFADKKERVEETYKEDISTAKVDELREEFISILNDVSTWNKRLPLQHTRYKQKNDFYTIFAFLARHRATPAEAKLYFYETLLRLDGAISPSQEKCEPLMEYALNCVSQSNSKDAREKRDALLKAIFENTSSDLNKSQKDIAKYFRMAEGAVVRKWGRTLLDNESLSLEA